MSGQPKSDDLDQDVVALIDEFVSLNDDESPEDIVDRSDRTLRFSRNKDLDITDRELEVEGGRHRIITEGGAAIIFQCAETGFEREYALKIPRPSILDEDEIVESRGEAGKQGQLSHLNVAYLVGAYPEAMPVDPWKPQAIVILQEWINEATPLDDYIHSDRTNEMETLIGLFRDVFRGLAHVHEKGLIHWDLKAENCLVDGGTGIVKITDVGNAAEKRCSGTYEEEEERFTSRKCLPDQIEEFGGGNKVRVEEYRGPNRVRVVIEPGTERLDRPWLDLYMAGRMIAEICGIEQEVGLTDPDGGGGLSTAPNILDADDDHVDMIRDFLIIVVRRLIRPLEGDMGGEEAVYYQSASEVADDLEKLLHEFGDAQDIPELYPIPQHVVRMPVTGNTEFSNRIDRIINSEPGMRLAGHDQLGLTRFVYPGAHHSRFEHLIGMIASTLQYVRALYADRTNPAFRLLCDSIHIRALIFAAAVHDMGHGAFSHYLEENPSLFKGCSNGEYIQAVLRDNPDLYEGYGESDSLEETHIQVDRSALEECAEDWINTDPPEPEETGEFMEWVADILNPRYSDRVNRSRETSSIFTPDLTDPQDTKEATIWILHSIIDSVLDADKLDYLRRDAEHTGIDYPGGADVDRFLQSLTVASHPPEPTPDDFDGFLPTIAVNQKGVNSLESLLLARYQVFKSVYWHRTARASTALLKDVVTQYLIRGGAETRDAYERRRAELLHRFRELNDEAALDWLFNELEKAGTATEDYRNSLTRRENLPKPVFDISQGELQPAFEEGSAYYDGCERIMEIHDRLHKLDPDAFYDAWEQLRKQVARTIEERINDVDEGEGSASAGFQLNSESLIIDVPLKGKDQIENLYVVDRPSGLRSNQGGGQVGPSPTGAPKYDVRPFDNYSPIADDVQVAFENWARRIRVFAWQETPEDGDDPGGRNEIISSTNYDEGQLAEIVFEALQEGFEEVEKEFFDDRPSSDDE